ncbi:MAG: xylulokinase, partial [Sciscionella sp.]
ARAEPQAERLRAVVGGDWLYERTGQWLDGRYLLPMYARLAVARPELAAQARHLVSAKDLLFHWLTEELLTDPSTAAGFGAYDVRSRRWLGEPLDGLAELLAAQAPRLPDVAASATTRPLCGAAARALGLPVGLPICLGAADSVLGALGLAATTPGAVAYVSGTSNVVLARAEAWIPDAQHRYLLTPLAHDDRCFGLELDLLATGSAIRWLSQLLAGVHDEARLVAQAAVLDPTAAPTFLPYLAPGEQGALWNADLHGTVLGLHLGHDGAQLVRGLLNGIVLESRRCTEILEQAGAAGGPLHVAGWCAADAGVRRDLADCCRLVVHAAAEGSPDCSAVGAARLLARSLGDPLIELGGDLEVRPDERRGRVWDALWERHERAREAVTVVYEAQEALCTES